MRALSLAALALLMPGAATAAVFACQFTTECIDTDACATTDYALTFAVAGEAPARLPATPLDLPPAPFDVTVTDSSGAFPAVALPDNGGFITFASVSAPRMLTQHDGIARYSVHLPEQGMALYFEGRCEEVEE